MIKFEDGEVAIVGNCIETNFELVAILSAFVDSGRTKEQLLGMVKCAVEFSDLLDDDIDLADLDEKDSKRLDEMKAILGVINMISALKETKSEIESAKTDRMLS